MELQGIIIVVGLWLFLMGLAEKGLAVAILGAPLGVGIVAAFGYGISLLCGISLAHGMAVWFGFMIVSRLVKTVKGLV